ncbi:MAG: tyrosine-type recombinase/integrase [Dehalococcoidia bacterium]|nr:tyrosine-type recombinase/integrase [Dehalococcoidia bacterium]
MRRRGKTWAVVVSLGRDDGGRYRYQWYPGFRTERDAEAKLTQLLRELDTGAYVKPTRETVGAFLSGWLLDYARTNVSPRTYEGYEHIIVRHLVPALGALPPSAALMLREHRESEKRRRELVDGSTVYDQQLVFARIDGSPIPPDSFSQAWRRLARRNGFHGVRLDDARHTHATLLLKQDVHPKIVQERLGHSTIATTLDIYSHVVPGLQDAAAQAFDTVLKGSPSQVF